MHAASVILLSWAMIGAACFFSNVLAGLIAGLLTLLVAVVGLPHGAADHRFAQPRLEPIFGMAWLPVFLGGYGAIAVAVVCGWFVTPGITTVVFFLASAWHFGAEERQFAIGPRWLRQVFRFARGGLVMWVPLVFHGAEVGEILALMMPHGSGPALSRAISLLTVCAWIMLPIAATAWMVQGLTAMRRTGRTRLVLLADNALVASLAVLFAVASPLVGFLVYFCAWHAARGLRRLRIEFGESWFELARSLAPLTAGAIVLIGLMTWLALARTGWHDTLIRATFVGLSAVAIPHLLLHGAAPPLAGPSRRRSMKPLHVGSPA